MKVTRSTSAWVVPLLVALGAAPSTSTGIDSILGELVHEVVDGIVPTRESSNAPVSAAARKTPVSADCSAKRDVAGSDVVLLMGQSNMSGRGQGYDEDLDGPNDPRVYQWSRSNVIIPASEHLEHHDFATVNEESVGLGNAFGRAYVETLPAQRDVLLVPTAHGGTGLVDGPWSPGGSLFEDAVVRLEAALASNLQGGNCVAAVLWHQGESDAIRKIDQEAYVSEWTTMIGALRTRVPAAAEAPAVLGEFTQIWIEENAEKAAPIVAAIRSIPKSVPFTAVAPSDGLSTNSGGRSSLIHFDAVAQREYGKRYFDKLADAIENNRISDA